MSVAAAAGGAEDLESFFGDVWNADTCGMCPSSISIFAEVVSLVGDS